MVSMGGGGVHLVSRLLPYKRRLSSALSFEAWAAVFQIFGDHMKMRE